MRERLLLLAAASIAFGASLGSGFHFDDYAIFSDPVLTSPWGWLQIWGWRQTRKSNLISLKQILLMVLVGLPSAVVFARLLYLIDNTVVALVHPDLADSGQVINFLQHPGQITGGEGLTIWGALLGASLGIWIYCKFAKIKIGRTRKMP